MNGRPAVLHYAHAVLGAACGASADEDRIVLRPEKATCKRCRRTYAYLRDVP